MGFKYTNKVLTKMSPFWQRRIDSGRYSYPCPGHISHYATRKHKPVGFFERWAGRGNKAYGLYWRTHPTEHR